MLLANVKRGAEGNGGNEVLGASGGGLADIWRGASVVWRRHAARSG